MKWQRVDLVFFVVNIAIICIYSIFLFKTEQAGAEDRKRLARWEKLTKTSGYVEMGRLSEVCWVRALDRMKLLKEDSEVQGIVMVFGLQDGKGHAWIEYKRGKDIVQYDPTTEKIVKLESKSGQN